MKRLSIAAMVSALAAGCAYTTEGETFEVLAGAESEMTPDEIAAAQKLFARRIKSGYRECE